jgi:hypothetical protein
MQSLDAALAFAITMLVLAMVVTTLVETLHRILGLREKGLALLLSNFYDRILTSRSAGASIGEDDRQAFIDMMTINRGPVGRAPMTALQRTLRVDARSEDRKFLNWIWGGRRLGALSLMTFMERLGSSEYGGRLVTQASAAGDRAVEWMLKDVAQKFEAFGVEASEYFEGRARLLSVIVGFVLAFAINVNALALFETFMRRPDVRQAVIERGSEVTKRYEELQKQVAAANTAIPAAGAATAAPPSGGATEAQRQVEDARASVQRAADETSASVSELRTLGVPIGWTKAAVADSRSQPARTLLGLILGGLLIGLGAPFWYKAVQALSGVRGAMRTTKDGPPSAAAPPQPPAGPTDVPRTPIDAFHAALGATLTAGVLGPHEEAVG